MRVSSLEHPNDRPAHIYIYYINSAAVGDGVVLAVLPCKLNSRQHRVCAGRISQTPEPHPFTACTASPVRVCRACTASLSVASVCCSFLRTASVGRDDETPEASDWPRPLREAQEARCDWPSRRPGSLPGAGGGSPQASLTDRVYTEGAMLMSGFL